MSRSTLGAVLVPISLLAAAVSISAHSSATTPLSFPVVVRNFGEVSSTTIDEAQSVVNVLFRPIGVQARWVTHDDLRRELPSAPQSPCEFASLVKLNLISTDAEIELDKDVLGTSVPAVGFVRVAPRRIAERADKAGVSQGFLMGEVIAHEIGHVLLPRGSHSLVGLMKERLDATDMIASRATLCPREAADMRATIVERQSACSALSLRAAGEVPQGR